MRLLVTLMLLLLSHPAQAQQLKYEQRQKSGDRQFVYQWRDADNQVHNLDFTLPMSQLPPELLKPKAYHPDAAQRRIYMALLEFSSQLDPRKANVRVHQRGNNLQWTIETSSSDVQARVQKQLYELRQSVMDQYLRSNYYHRFESFVGQEGIKPDHIRYARESREPLLPVSQALYQYLDSKLQRPYINLLLSWLQTIPYNPLENRLQSNGSGYLSPTDVIANNVGDCDSKTTLAGSLLATMLPEMSTAIIYLPNHALLGLKLAPLPGEKTVQLDGETFVLAEPTGPAQLPIGEIATESARAIDTGMYHHERF